MLIDLIFAYVWFCLWTLFGVAGCVGGLAKQTSSGLLIMLGTAVYCGLAYLGLWANYTVVTHLGLFQ